MPWKKTSVFSIVPANYSGCLAAQCGIGLVLLSTDPISHGQYCVS